MTSVLVGAGLALLALAFVLAPILRARHGADASSRAAPLRREPEAASDAEVEAALAEYRRGRPSCPQCGPRPETDAAYCSNCGRKLDGA